MADVEKHAPLPGFQCRGNHAVGNHPVLPPVKAVGKDIAGAQALQLWHAVRGN